MAKIKTRPFRVNYYCSKRIRVGHFSLKTNL